MLYSVYMVNTKVKISSTGALSPSITRPNMKWFCSCYITVAIIIILRPLNYIFVSSESLQPDSAVTGVKREFSGLEQDLEPLKRPRSDHIHYRK